MSKNVYVKCPRCELNFILKKDRYCQVCKQEMQALATNFADDKNKEMGLCPICKVNFVTEDETVCSTCMSETDLTEDELDTLYGGVIVPTAEGHKDEETASALTDTGDEEEEMEIISISDMGEEEEEEEDTSDEEASADPLDDFDESFVEESEDDEEEAEEEEAED